MTLKELKPGKAAAIVSVGGEGELRQHFLDMGLIPGAEVTMVKLAPLGDPMELSIHGYELTLRLEDAEKIEIREIAHAAREPSPENESDVEHPGPISMLAISRVSQWTERTAASRGIRIPL